MSDMTDKGKQEELEKLEALKRRQDQARKHGPAIVRICSYHRTDLDEAVIYYSHPVEELRGITSSVTSILRLPTEGLGWIPATLIGKICLHLDIASLFRFRQVNLLVRHAVNQQREFRVAMTYAMGVLCALMQTGCAEDVTLGEFYDLLCRDECETCGEGFRCWEKYKYGSNYGNLVHLPTWTRTCSRCLRDCAKKDNKISSLDMVKLSTVTQSLGLWDDMIPRLKVFNTLLGIYCNIDRQSSIQLVRVLDAMLLYNEMQQTRRTVEYGFTDHFEREKTQEPKPDSYKTESLAFKIKQLKSNDTLNDAACIAIPWYNPYKNKAEHGISCHGCRWSFEHKTYWRTSCTALQGIPECTDRPSMVWTIKESRDIVYSVEGFLEHYPNCVEAHWFWDSSERGRRIPEDTPLICWEDADHGGLQGYAFKDKPTNFLAGGQPGVSYLILDDD